MHCLRMAPTAAAAGEACEVPDMEDVPPPRPFEVMTDPGARISRRALLLLKQLTLLLDVVASKQLAGTQLPEGGCRPLLPS